MDFLDRGSPQRAVVLLLPLAVASVVAWSVFTLLSFRSLGDGSWLFTVPLGWALGTVGALGWGAVGLRPARLVLGVVVTTVVLGGFFADRLARPDLDDPFVGVRDVDLALWIAMGEIPDERLRSAVGVSAQEWASVSESQRAQLEAPILRRLQDRLEGHVAPPRLSFSRFLRERLTEPFVFFCAGLSLALAWRAARGGDPTSLVWLARSEVTVD